MFKNVGHSVEPVETPSDSASHQAQNGLGLLALYAGLVIVSAYSSGASTCGPNCVGNLCTYGHFCDKGCKYGFFGPSCTESCPLSCATCEQPFSYHKGCVSCKTGFYGKSCELTCTDKCLNSICDKDNGSCSDGCVANFTGDMCCTNAGPCITCLSTARCKTCQGNFIGNNCGYCQDGTHGSKCDKTCNENCKNNVCDRHSGSCTEGCKGNFAPNECKDCNPGFWSPDCTNACPINCDDTECDRKTGSCISCKSGRHGPSCNKQCSLNCRIGTCDWETGKCDQGCKDGFSGDMCDSCVTGKYGTKCDKSCPGNCQGGVCDRSMGHCTRGCNGNYAGNTCDRCVDGKHGKICSETCPPNCLNTACERETGICIGGCKPNFTGDKCCTEHGHCQTCSSHTDCSQCINGYHGNTCSESCSSGCNSSSCDRHTGDCSHGCKKRFYGDKCCLENGYCSKCSNNSECEECKTNYYGNLCNKRCPRNCDRNKCDRNNGICSLGCKRRYSGDRCCSTGQCQTCSSDTVCAVCKAGYYGSNCDLRCSPRCKEMECHKENGTCINGCQDGFTGDKCCLQGGHCDRCSSNVNCGQCKPGYYGHICKSECSDGCNGKVCDRYTGKCSNGCLVGITGDKCCQKDGFCKTCDTSSECSICTDGYFGQDCDQECSIGCAYRKCEKTSGNCDYSTCKSGYSGDKCCVKNNNCKVCSTTFDCSKCKRGFYGTDCQHPCQANCMYNKCKKPNGVCSKGCEKGYHGEKCDKSCPGNCRDDKCRQDDGTCYNCVDGFYRDDCTKTCSPYCSNYNCTQNDGACAPCKDGYHGPTCRLKCYTNCISCSSHRDCGSRCKEGYHGSGCRSICPRNCAACTSETQCTKCKPGYKGTACQEECSSCKPGTKCDQTSGYCYDACKDGYNSHYCNKKCGANCASCLRYYSYMCTQCISGRHGDWSWDGNKNYSFCSKTCSKDCANGLCNERTGQCMTCPGSLHGPYCNCPEQCDQCRVDGSCTECKETFANPSLECNCREDMCLGTDGGDRCKLCVNATWYQDTAFSACCPCRNTCKDSLCDAEDFCTDGCELGYYGNGCKRKCDDRQHRCVSCELGSGGEFLCKECQTGYYPHGNNCEHCSLYCINGTCDPSSGQCTHGCKDGYWDETCDKECADCSQARSSPATRDNSGLITVAAAASVCLLVLIGVIAGLAFRFIRKRHREQINSTNKEDNKPAETPVNNDENVQVEPVNDTYERVDTEPGTSNGDRTPVEESPYHMYESVATVEPRAADDNDVILDYEEPQTKTHEDVQLEPQANTYEGLQSERPDHAYGSVETGEPRSNTYEGLHMELARNDAPYSELGELRRDEEILYVNTKL